MMTRCTLAMLFALAFAGDGLAASVALAWNPSSSGVAGYYLYHGNASRQYSARINVGDKTQFTLAGLPAGATYYFAVTAYNDARMESVFSNEASASLPLGADSMIYEVVEFYEPSLNHYFISGDPQEQAIADSGYVGNWRRTGNTFKAGGTVPVCRFYGNTAIDPATGSRFGPNSHFFTADATECSFLNALFNSREKSWMFESYDFRATPAIDRNCPPGTEPVYRAYNNGFAQGIDSNHRITNNRNAIFEVVAQGWIDEGVVFCAPR